MNKELITFLKKFIFFVELFSAAAERQRNVLYFGFFCRLKFWCLLNMVEASANNSPASDNQNGSEDNGASSQAVSFQILIGIF